VLTKSLVTSNNSSRGPNRNDKQKKIVKAALNIPAEYTANNNNALRVKTCKCRCRLQLILSACLLMCSSTESSRPRPRPRLFVLELSTRSRAVLEDPSLRIHCLTLLQCALYYCEIRRCQVLCRSVRNCSGFRSAGRQLHRIN